MPCMLQQRPSRKKILSTARGLARLTCGWLLAALAQVTAFYHGLVTSASSRQFFLSAEPYDLPQPKQRRDYRKVTFK